MTINIVTVNVTQTIAPAPSQLQRTGAFVSQGGTTLAAGTTQLLTQASDLSAILTGSVAISTAVWASSVVTITTATPHGIPVSDVVEGIIVGITPTAYNGTFDVTSTGTNTFTYALVSNPGASTITASSKFTLEDVQDLVAMNTTFFAQGSANAVYVLELGVGEAADGIAALTTYIADPTVIFYSYLVPTSWTDEATMHTLCLNSDSTTAKRYFWLTASLSNYTDFAGLKSAVLTVQDVNALVTECSAAALFYNALNYNPSNTNKVAPFAFQFVVGVTAFSGSRTTKQLLKTANANYIDTGAEGGISNTLIYWGVTSDGRDFTYWYSVDWVQINVELILANAVINGSNNPINPLYYNQAGINTLQKVAQGTMNSGIAFGLVLGPVTVMAVSFNTYVTDNPSDYAIGKYAGLSVSYTPARGFTQIIFNVNVTDFALA
jgi:hypothetical protein